MLSLSPRKASLVALVTLKRVFRRSGQDTGTSPAPTAHGPPAWKSGGDRSLPLVTQPAGFLHGGAPRGRACPRPWQVPSPPGSPAWPQGGAGLPGLVFYGKHHQARSFGKSTASDRCGTKSMAGFTGFVCLYKHTCV